MKTKKLVLTALFTALCFIGANIKVMGTIAFDSLPAFIASLILGPVYGAIIGAVGHFLTALTSGFPLTLPVHIITMVMMGVTMAAFAATYKFFYERNRLLGLILSIVVAVLINGPLSLLVLSPILIPMMGKVGVIALLVPLSIVSGINVLGAILVYKLMPAKLEKSLN